MKTLFKLLATFFFILASGTVFAYAAGYRLYQIHPDMTSMVPTLNPGDYFLADVHFSKTILKRGDIVVIRHPGLPFHPIITKRIVGLGSETIRVRNHRVSIDRMLLVEEYILIDKSTPRENFNSLHQMNDFPEKVIPPGKLFVMGDHRNVSFDSRDEAFGFIETNWIVGKIVFY